MSAQQRRRRVNSIYATPSAAAAEEAAKGSVIAPESVDINAAINTFLRQCEVRNLTANSIRYYRECLAVLKRLLADQGIKAPADVAQIHIDECILRRKKEVPSENTVNTSVRAWRAFFNFLRSEGFIAGDFRVKPIKTDIKHVPTFSKPQLKRLLAQPDRSTFTGYRDYVIMLALLDTMARISELLALKTSDIDWQRGLIRVSGKNRKDRFVPFQNTLRRHLRAYLEIRGLLDHDYVFVTIDNEPISKRTVQQEIDKYGKAAGITDVRVSPHTFRHTGAVMFLLNGGDIRSLQKILDHSSLSTTEVYLNLVAADISKQHRKASPLEALDDADD